jgi:hypothetical protein
VAVIRTFKAVFANPERVHTKRWQDGNTDNLVIFHVYSHSRIRKIIHDDDKDIQFNSILYLFTC